MIAIGVPCPYCGHINAFKAEQMMGRAGWGDLGKLTCSACDSRMEIRIRTFRKGIGRRRKAVMAEIAAKGRALVAKLEDEYAPIRAQLLAEPGCTCREDTLPTGKTQRDGHMVPIYPRHRAFCPAASAVAVEHR